MNRVYIGFGEDMSRALADQEYEEVVKLTNELGNQLTYRDFETEAEAKAYIQGINDMYGWLDFWILEDLDIDKLSEMIDLNKLDPPAQI